MRKYNYERKKRKEEKYSREIPIEIYFLSRNFFLYSISIHSFSINISNFNRLISSDLIIFFIFLS